ncbi:hypothetical protein EDEG_01494 [Edhazardia aedis USNM 41457]|uniref:Uncharacterized protein n=1 Tax=Edhazardia aedis (strain USNM 41457) TaxID=1003232 RepID=J8ZX11_EDHAE|nr:hypothetical protein EDEG_01494 [Edhazardia aedis USNM 41457]|eukprot:EJW04213.1 hypothetical protein EDEG_01494 [Edhazardia aedis USNM 41457]
MFEKKEVPTKKSKAYLIEIENVSLKFSSKDLLASNDLVNDYSSITNNNCITSNSNNTNNDSTNNNCDTNVGINQDCIVINDTISNFSTSSNRNDIGTNLVLNNFFDTTIISGSNNLVNSNGNIPNISSIDENICINDVLVNIPCSNNAETVSIGCSEDHIENDNGIPRSMAEEQTNSRNDCSMIKNSGNSKISSVLVSSKNDEKSIDDSKNRNNSDDINSNELSSGINDIVDNDRITHIGVQKNTNNDIVDNPGNNKKEEEEKSLCNLPRIEDSKKQTRKGRGFEAIYGITAYKRPIVRPTGFTYQFNNREYENNKRIKFNRHNSKVKLNNVDTKMKQKENGKNFKNDSSNMECSNITKDMVNGTESCVILKKSGLSPIISSINAEQSRITNKNPTTFHNNVENSTTTAIIVNTDNNALTEHASNHGTHSSNLENHINNDVKSIDETKKPEVKRPK